MREPTPARLSDVAEIRSSNVDKLSVRGELDVQLCNYMDVYSNERITPAMDFMRATATPPEIARFRVERGDVLMTKDSETPDDIGIPAVVTDDIPDLVCGYHLALLRPDKNKVDASYLSKWLGGAEAAAYFARVATGSTRFGLTYNAIANTPVRLPSLAQQQRTAEVLFLVDEAIEQTEALIAKTQQIKAGLMHDLFTRGVTPDGQLRPPREQAPQLYRESPLGWIPAEWSIERLDALADVNRGKFSIRPRNDPRYYDGPYPFIQTGDVASADGRATREYTQTLNSQGLAVSRLFPEGTVMVTIAANIADTCILAMPMCAPDSLVGIVPNNSDDSSFLEMSVRRRKRFLESRAPQTAQKNINLEDLRPLLVAWPDCEERVRFTQRYAALESGLDRAKQNLHKLSELRAGLTHDLLTGRVPVPVDIREPVAAEA